MDNITLHHGDCLEFQKTLDPKNIFVISDPPYGMGKHNKFGNRNNLITANPYTPIQGDDKPFDPAPFLQYEKVILFGANWYADKLPPSGGWIVWDKKDGGNSDDFSDGEMAWVKGSNIVRIIHHKWRGMIKASERNQKRVHPAQKPIFVMRWIIEKYAKPDDIIFDPYMGSGTTGVAAAQAGFSFIGCETVKNYFDIAEKRIADEVQKISLEKSQLNFMESIL